MTKACLYDSSDYSEWDEFVSSHPLGQIYHTGTWKEVVEESFKHIRAKYLVARENSSGRIEAGLPLFEVKSWLVGNRLVCVPFGTLCDPLVRSEDDFNILYDLALRIKKESNCRSIQIKLFQGNEFLKNGNMTKRPTHKHHFLALDKDFDQLTKKFKRTVRQSVRKAVESELEVLEGKNEIDLKKFYRLYIETRKRNFVPAQPYLFFYNLWSKFSPEGHLTLVLVNKESTTVGAGILLKFKQRVTLEFLASDSRFLADRPNHLLAWSAIKTALEEGYRVFDFGRTAPEDQGLMRFKKYWGTVIVDLMMASEAEENNSSAYDRNGLGWKTASFLSGKLPGFLYRAFSSYCYRHLG